MNLNNLPNFEHIDKLVPKNYLQLSLETQKKKEQAAKELLEKRKLPSVGWSDAHIEAMVQQLAAMDSNNFANKAGLGEREARICCNLVARRHYNFGHGIGRSGDLMEAQPKAAGSTLLSNITNALLLDLIQEMGVRNCKACFLVPMATGMTLTLCLLALRKQRPDPKLVLWSRIDQKACFKCIVTAGMEPLVIEPVQSDGGALTTNVAEFETLIEDVGVHNVFCLLTTTSCFAPRECDDVVAIAQLAKKYDVPHVVNNAYGLQSTFITHQLEQAHKSGRVDLFVQSTDKNLMMPVGGAIVAGESEQLVAHVSKTYAGRASSTQTLDTFMTLLSLGKQGYMAYVRERKEAFQYLRERLMEFAREHNERVIENKRNPISLALTLSTLHSHCTDAAALPSKRSVTMFGSMLYTRGVSGVRVVNVGVANKIDGFEFCNWGSHSAATEVPYLTVAAAIGVKRSEIDAFFEKLRKCWDEFLTK